jgi:type I restriction enzyme S subunit
MTPERLEDLAHVTAGTSPKGDLINTLGLGLPFFQGTKEFGELFPAEKRFTEHPVRIAKQGEILIGVRAPVGEVNLARVDSAIGRGVMSIAPKSPEVGNFLFYFLKNLQGKWDSLGSSGSVFENLSAATLRGIQVPKNVAKKSIGDILWNLDLKIQINKQLATALEDIAQTIFKSWFIDFDPVKAKMTGEKPGGMDDATAALFPDSMEDSELGLIPSGWVIQSLDDIADYLNGLAMQKFPVTDADRTLPVIKIAQLRAGNTRAADIASGLLDDKYIVSDGDILFSWSGTLEVEIWSGGPGALNQHLFKVSGKSQPAWFAYFGTRYFLESFRQIANGKATTMGHIQRAHLSEAQLPIPPDLIVEKLAEIISPLMALSLSAKVQNKSLVSIRDSLLPRLISGELQIPEEMLAS